MLCECAHRLSLPALNNKKIRRQRYSGCYDWYPSFVHSSVILEIGAGKLRVMFDRPITITEEMDIILIACSKE
jgi:hypothetical protein